MPSTVHISCPCGRNYSFPERSETSGYIDTLCPSCQRMPREDEFLSAVYEPEEVRFKKPMQHHRDRLPPRGKSGLKGVLFLPKLKNRPWKAYIRNRGQFILIGYFATKEEAGAAYNAKALRIYGPSTFLNG